MDSLLESGSEIRSAALRPAFSGVTEESRLSGSLNSKLMNDLLPNTALSHYRIVSKLGAGGMGEVYLAHDQSLDRKVAIKVLPTDLASHRDRMERFIREAKSAAALNHPNIATIHEIGESDGTKFIAMEYIDGVTLREKIYKERTELGKLLRHLQRVAEGLAKAHAAGIVHRDLKPDNIMITHDGHVKILDFGLAKLMDQQPLAGGDSSELATAMMPQHSAPGAIMGTVGYMSPEQAKAKSVDQRSDIFSFGCLLYEATTGHKPFMGDSVVDTLHKIIHEPAPSITDFNPSAPAELQRIIRKCLAKEPDKRYQTIRDTTNDLEEVIEELKGGETIERSVAPSSTSTTSGSPNTAAATSTASTSQPVSSAEFIATGIRRHKVSLGIAVLAILLALGGLGFYLRRSSSGAISSIAVMPFVNEKGDADLEYLADGITETVISRLSQIPNLNVKARSFVYRYKGKEIDPQTVGKELNVQAILSGRVVPRGSDFTVYLELVDTKTGNLIWADRYNRKQSDLVSLQVDLARDVSTKLRAKLSGSDEQKLTKKYTENSEAYNLYLQGRFYAGKRTPADTEKALECFRQAVKADPNFALAYTGLAVGYTYQAVYGNTPAKEVFPKAREFAQKSLELDNTLAEPHQVLGLLLFLQDHDLSGWERESKRAVELNPNSADAHRLEGLRLLIIGRFDESAVEVKRALEIEPLSVTGNLTYATLLYFSGRFADAEAQLKKTIELSSDFWLTHYYLSNAYRLQGNYAGAAEELARAKEQRGDVATAKMIRDGMANGGWQGVTRAVLSDAGAADVLSYDRACFYAESGDKDKAFATINQAIDNHDYFVNFLMVEPILKPLHEDPRFKETLKKLGLGG